MCVKKCPGQISRIANDVAVDNVADSSNPLSGKRKQGGSVEYRPKGDIRSPARNEDREHYPKDATVKRHAPFPGGKDAPRLLQIRADGLLNDVVEPPAEEARNRRRPEELVDLIVVYAALIGILSDNPHSHHDSEHVHQPVPAKRYGADVQQDWIQVDGDD